MSKTSDRTLWSAAEAAAATGGTAHGNWRALDVELNSRRVTKGTLFIALKGANTDGHDHVAGALEAGAAAAMVAHVPSGLPEDAPLLIVPDVRAGLYDLARVGRLRSRARICAVTGSLGKTGTKEMLRAALAESGETFASFGNYNNDLGVPLSMAALPYEARFGVFEIGMNHPGEIAPLAVHLMPHVAIITTVAPVHTEFFPDMAAIADAKGEILGGLGPDGVVVLPRDNPFYAHLLGAARTQGIGRILSFGTDAASDAVLIDYDPTTSEVCARINGRTMRYRIGMDGTHWALASLAVLLGVEAMGADIDAAVMALAAVTPTPGRGQVHRIPRATGVITLIDESYNASPDSMRAALDALGRRAEKGRRIAVLGDMFELGKASAKIHADLAEAVLAAGIDRLYTCGDLMRHLADAIPERLRGGHAKDCATLTDILRVGIRDGDTLLVKGSNGMKMNMIVDALLAGQGAKNAV